VDVIAEPELRCAACEAPLVAADRFCERCGARTAESDAADAAEGEAAQPPVARLEVDLEIVAAVTDTGRTRRRNEDAFELRALGELGVAVVVCDGISSAVAGDLAARCAAEAAADVLVEALRDPLRDSRAATLEAVTAASAAVGRVSRTVRVDRAMPSCTLVSALCRDGELVIGWLGDSRAYWISTAEARQLTVDDSWAGEQVAEGLLTPAQAMRDPRSHAITHWIGVDAPDDPPQTVELRPEESGHLVLCTDGLWNYVATADELARLRRALPAAAAPVAIARSLADTALARGGHDNITVAVVEIWPQRRQQ
jgi:serine/threonine protein phosphatase PrpC